MVELGVEFYDEHFEEGFTFDHSKDLGFAGAGNSSNPEIWLRPEKFGGANGISSVHLEQYSPEKKPAVTLYEADCTG